MGNKMTEWLHLTDNINHRHVVVRNMEADTDPSTHEMYIVLPDGATGHGWLGGGGTFSMSMYDEDDRNRALKEYGMEGEDVDDGTLALGIFLCNYSNFDTMRSFKSKEDAEAYVDGLIEASVRGEN